MPFGIKSTTVQWDIDIKRLLMMTNDFKTVTSREPVDNWHTESHFCRNNRTMSTMSIFSISNTWLWHVSCYRMLPSMLLETAVITWTLAFNINSDDPSRGSKNLISVLMKTATDVNLDSWNHAGLEIGFTKRDYLKIGFILFTIVIKYK